jgi:hypothetical protein
MKSLWFPLKVMALLLVCAGLAASDSLELRNGRHLQGKYVGGTAAVIGFMTGNTVQYFATSDVLALIFDNIEAPMSGARPDPMKGVSPGSTQHGNMRLARTESRIRKDKTTPKLVRTSAHDSSDPE